MVSGVGKKDLTLSKRLVIKSKIPLHIMQSNILMKRGKNAASQVRKASEFLDQDLRGAVEAQQGKASEVLEENHNKAKDLFRKIFHSKDEDSIEQHTKDAQKVMNEMSNQVEALDDVVKDLKTLLSVSYGIYMPSAVLT